MSERQKPDLFGKQTRSGAKQGNQETREKETREERVAMGALHISVMVFYYLRHSGAGEYLWNVQVSTASQRAAFTTPPGAEDVAVVSANVTEVTRIREKCPETSPHLVAMGALHISVMVFYYLRHSGASEYAWSEQVSTASQRAAFTTPPGAEDVAVVSANVTEVTRILEKCPETSPHLVGPLRVEFSDPVDLDLIRQEPLLMDGGHYKPSECLSVQKVALIIPFRHREQHLKYWLNYLHPILQRQQLDYGIYVIEQDGEGTFNRAKLMNVGYAEALKEYDYDCFVFSDVDIIPMDDRNTYRCYEQPRHLSVAVDKFGFKLPYAQIFGGVTALSKDQYLKINGFPNNYWGWGGEDDDVFNRLKFREMFISRPDVMTGKCKMIRHNRDEKNEPNPQRFDRIVHTRETMDTDGINSLTYSVVKVEKDKLFTKITVDIGKP
ncbi:beta-1,4-galactosyltransferase 1-like isoform X2 [Brachyhypopomus gauderio]|uniref:beta-1,4-galactosyltransferase 1-like isoform X2 n=1 Tax=Brachyhypopomus gauderio TaxID=698409 RepID=UPI004043928E